MAQRCAKRLLLKLNGLLNFRDGHFNFTSCFMANCFPNIFLMMADKNFRLRFAESSPCEIGRLDQVLFVELRQFACSFPRAISQ